MMKVTKYIHSCLVVETEGKKILIDPGNYTYEANALNIESLEKLDYLLITHEHSDHMYIPFIKKIIAKFPDVIIITNSSAKMALKNENIFIKENFSDFIKTESVIHEKVFDIKVAESILFNIGNIFTHPGDSLHFELKTPMLALPIQGAWCNLTQAVEFAESLKPEVVLPIHDWHWNDKARDVFYNRLEKHFAGRGIRFIGLKTGEAVTI